MIRIITRPEKVTSRRAHTGKPQRVYAQCEWNGQTVSVLQLSAITALARKLLNASCPDQPWESQVDGQPSLHGSSLHACAKRIIVERDRGGFTNMPFSMHPHSMSRGSLKTADDEEAEGVIAGQCLDAV